MGRCCAGTGHGSGVATTSPVSASSTPLSRTVIADRQPSFTPIRSMVAAKRCRCPTKGARPSRIFPVPRQPYHVRQLRLADVQQVHPQGLGAVGPPGRAAALQGLEIFAQPLQGRRRRAPRVRRQKHALRPPPRLEGPHRRRQLFPGPGVRSSHGLTFGKAGRRRGSPALRDRKTSGDTVYSFKGDTPSRWVEVSNGRSAGLTLALPCPFGTLKSGLLTGQSCISCRDVASRNI